MDRRIDVLSSTELSARGLASRVGNSNFQGSIAVQARQTLEETPWLLELAERSPGIWAWLVGSIFVLENAVLNSDLHKTSSACGVFCGAISKAPFCA